MHQARIAELLEPFLSSTRSLCHSEPAKGGAEPAVLSITQLHDISTYIDILLRWNASINLTAIRTPEEIVTRHFGESLFAARHLFPCFSSVSPIPSVVKGLARLADLGSGAGFPGLPIKLWAPNIALTLIESNHKKATFLREVVRSLTLTDVNIQNTRAGDLPPGLDFDVVTLRAVERFTDVLKVATALLATGGRLALLIGSSQLDHAYSALPEFAWDHAIPVPSSQSRLLLVGRRNHKR
jgi:16S rRNA (guanine527-N7)-methyltransferase